MQTIIVERRNENQKLQNLLTIVSNNSLRVGFIVGDRGDGKTTLGEHFAEVSRSRDKHLRYAIGTCQEITKEQGYEPFHDIFAQLTGLRAQEIHSAMGSEREFDLKQNIHIATETLVKVAPDLIDIFVPGVSLLSKIVGVASNQIIKRRIEAGKDANITGERLKDQCESYFRELSQKGSIILLIDDAQWIDPLSLKLLQHLQIVLQDTALLILVTYRPNEASDSLIDWHNQLVQEHGDITIDLSIPSEEDASRAFITRFLELNRCVVSQDFITEFHKRTHAKPLFAAELLHYLITSGVLVESPLGIYEENVDMSHWTETPVRITRADALINNRLKMFNDVYMEILHIASIQGYEFLAQPMVTIMDKPERLVLEMLTELERKHGLVKEVGEENVGSTILSRFRFTNILYQESIYGGMGLAVRRKRHGEIAEALEELYKEDPSAASVYLAKHYERASNFRKASEYLIVLGKQQLDNRQSKEGFDNLLKALSLARNCNYIDGIIDSLRYLGMELVEREEEEVTKAEELLSEAIELARKHENPKALSYSLRALGRVRRSQMKNSEAMFYYMDALNIAKQQGDLFLASSCLNNIGVLARFEGRNADAIYFFNERLSISEKLHHADGIVISHLNLSYAYRAENKLELSRKHINEGYKALERRNDWLRESGLKISEAYLLIDEGELVRASHILLDALQMATAREHARRSREGLICASDIFAHLGQVSLAAKVLGYAEAKSPASPEVRRVKTYLNNQGDPAIIESMSLLGSQTSLAEIRTEAMNQLTEITQS
jgi:predicted ATPase